MSGLRAVVQALDGVDPAVAADVKRALFEIGLGVARARGPYGRQIGAESQPLLLLLADLLEVRPASEASP